MKQLYICYGSAQKLKTIYNNYSIYSTLKFNLHEELFIFNIGKQYSTIFMIIILETKYYIFSSKRLNIPLSINAFKNKMNWSFKAYEHIAQKNKELGSFEREWKSVMQAFK